MDHEAHSRKKFVNMKSQRVKVDDSFAPALEDETETVEHLLAEPKSEYVTVDGVLCFGKENAGKCLNIEDFSCGFDYAFNTYSGGLHSANPRGGHNVLELGDLDGLLDEVDEVEDIHATNGLASPCDDYLLDIEFAGKASELDFGPCERSHAGKSRSESQSPGLSGSSNSAVGISESSTVTIQEFECKNHSLDKAATHEFHGDFRRKKKRRAPVEGSSFPTLFAGENETSTIEANRIGAFLKEKRQRKPTRRYIEEFSDKKSKDFKEREIFSAITSRKEQRLKVRSQNELHHTRPRTLSTVPEEDSISENQTLAEFRNRRGRPKKHASILALESDVQPITSESESESETESESESESESEDEHVTTKRSKKHDRRKHQRMWTLSEVMKLVDGISEYGVGRWTDIKRLLFSTSAYRTPIDLRDKWRNLLRTSCAKKLKREVGDKQHAMRPLPKSLLRRVRELAKIHPYPRVRGKKFNAHVALPMLPTDSKGPSSSDLIRKYVRRKSCSQS